jgi:hypothetical protein
MKQGYNEEMANMMNDEDDLFDDIRDTLVSKQKSLRRKDSEGFYQEDEEYGYEYQQSVILSISM